jgi:large subunit ribosomal protein L9e
MKEINTFQLVKVPEGIEASVKSRIVTVKGARGSLSKDFKHLAVDIYMPDKKTIKVCVQQPEPHPNDFTY